MIKKILTATLLIPSFSMALYAAPAIADTVIVKNDNNATVDNLVVVKADTGGNTADGSYGGDGGEAGSGSSGPAAASGGASATSGSGSGGNGGDGGMGGDGGVVLTGDARAKASVKNLVNTNKTDIAPCNCDEDPCDPCGDALSENLGGDHPCPCDFVKVKNNNQADVHNKVIVKADTGDNSADGSEGGSGGSAGSGSSGPASGSGSGSSATSGDGDGGNGGDGGAGGWGGLIQTGDAKAKAKVVNVVNTNLTRVRH